MAAVWAAVCAGLAVAALLHPTNGALTNDQLDKAFTAGGTTARDYISKETAAFNSKYYLQQPSSALRHQYTTHGEVPPDYEYPAYLFCAATTSLVTSGLVRPQDAWALRNENLAASSSQQVRNALQQCNAALARPTCPANPSNLYTFDGSCNNPSNGMLGRTNSCHRRILQPAYDDGVDAPRRRSVTGRGDLPNARTISLNALTRILSRVGDDPNFNHNRMSFGQFIAHDVTLTPSTTIGANNAAPDCCNTNNQMFQCFPIAIAATDPVYRNRGCMNFVRSEPCPSCALGPREQMNAVTPFVDLSHIYGLTPQIARNLRSGRGGRLRGQFPKTGSAALMQDYPLLMPADLNNTDGCSTRNRPCFLGGDPLRVNQQIGISAWSTLWFRYHNFLADRINLENPGWSDEKIYQTARRIAQAHMQLIVFREWLPTVIGDDLTRMNQLYVDGARTTYNQNLNPNLWSEFATGAFRFGHSIIQNVFQNRDYRGDYALTGMSVMTRDAFSRITDYYDTNTAFIAENFVAGMYRQPGKQISFSFAEGVTHDTYRLANETNGMDLPALNTQRGRDHGVQPYYMYAQEYISRMVGGNGVTVQNWNDIAPFWRPECTEVLRTVYLDFRDVDLYVGGLCELPIQTGSVGPTFGEIIALQMRELKFGDRLFVSHSNNFNAAQYTELLRTGLLAEVVCRASEFQPYVYRDAFRYNQWGTYSCSEKTINTRLFTNFG